jgi:hypothetical protein
MYKFTKGNDVKFQKTLVVKKDLEELGWKLDEPKKVELKAEKPKAEPKKKTARKKKDN